MESNPTPSQSAPRPGTENVAPSAGTSSAWLDADVAMMPGTINEEAEAFNTGGDAGMDDV
eukprot:11348562-Heterocapsa_arctica.AAC.1